MSRMPLSHSGMQLFEDCPRRFHAERVQKIKGAPSLPMILGSFLHEVTDRYFKHLVKGGKQSDFFWIEQCAKDMWRERMAHPEFNLLPEILFEEMIGLVYAIREGCIINPAQIVASEQDLSFNEKWEPVAWNAKDVFFRAKIDRLELDAELTALVWDLKTGRRIDKDSNTPQTRIYAFLVKLIMPEARKIVAQLYFPRKRALDPYEFDIEGLEGVRELIMRTSDQVEEARIMNRWPARVGRACRDCPVYGTCPEKQKTTMGAIEPPKTVEDAEKLLKRWVIMEREREEIKDSLKEYVDMNGPVEGGGMMADYVLKHKLSFDTEALYKVLQEAGVNPLRFLRGDPRLIAREVKKNEAFRDKIDPITKDKPSTSFMLKNAGDDDEDDQ